MCQLHSYMSIVTGVAKDYIRLQTTLIWISQSARKMRNHASRYSIDMLGLQPSSGHTPHYGCVLKDEKENNNVKSLRRFTIPCIVRVLGMPHNLTYSQKIWKMNSGQDDTIIGREIQILHSPTDKISKVSANVLPKRHMQLLDCVSIILVWYNSKRIRDATYWTRTDQTIRHVWTASDDDVGCFKRWETEDGSQSWAARIQSPGASKKAGLPIGV